MRETGAASTARNRWRSRYRRRQGREPVGVSQPSDIADPGHVDVHHGIEQLDLGPAIGAAMEVGGDPALPDEQHRQAVVVPLVVAELGAQYPVGITARQHLGDEVAPLGVELAHLDHGVDDGHIRLGIAGVVVRCQHADFPIGPLTWVVSGQTFIEHPLKIARNSLTHEHRRRHHTG